jgi:hypothetical protein
MRTRQLPSALLAILAASSPALAGEEVLEFRLVTTPVDMKVVEVAAIDGQTVRSGKAWGVAYFKDGRIAVKDFAISAELLKGNGPIRGFSTYTFEDGSSITASFVGEYKDGKGHGDYTILSGTGKYANATGTGSFDGATGALKGANLYNGKFSLKTP